MTLLTKIAALSAVTVALVVPAVFAQAPARPKANTAPNAAHKTVTKKAAVKKAAVKKAAVKKAAVKKAAVKTP